MGAEIVGCSFDEVPALARFATKQRFEFPLLSDSSREIAIAYGAADSKRQPLARRAAALITPEGTIAEWHPQVKAHKYPDEQLERLRQKSEGRRQK